MKNWSKWLLIFIFGAIVGVSLFVGITYYVSSYAKKENKNENVSNSENKVQNIKIDNTKDYVYDIKYDYSFVNEMKINTIVKGKRSFGDGLDFETFATRENANAIKIPFINIDNGSSEKINGELKKLYLKYMEYLAINRGCEEEKNGEHIQNCVRYNLNYQVYESEKLNVLSVLVLQFSSDTTVPAMIFWGYTFDLETGNLLNIENIAKKINVSVEELKKLTIDKINNKIDSLEEGLYNKEESIKYYNNNLNKYFNNEYYEAEVDGGLIYYFNNNGKLNIITSLYSPISQFEYDIFNIKIDN